VTKDDLCVLLLDLEARICLETDELVAYGLREMLLLGIRVHGRYEDHSEAYLKLIESTLILLTRRSIKN
jgi:hypothetical protein